MKISLRYRKGDFDFYTVVPYFYIIRIRGLLEIPNVLLWLSVLLYFLFRCPEGWALRRIRTGAGVSPAAAR